MKAWRDRKEAPQTCSCRLLQAHRWGSIFTPRSAADMRIQRGLRKHLGLCAVSICIRVKKTVPLPQTVSVSVLVSVFFLLLRAKSCRDQNRPPLPLPRLSRKRGEETVLFSPFSLLSPPCGR